mmetsp:Transcript_37721/g.89235  ORF Transcript_37721/g.89235 Transcript_37721/m.89235 type:complete len:217 (-) Transcript_37721:490-1140(-)
MRSLRSIFSSSSSLFTFSSTTWHFSSVYCTETAESGSRISSAPPISSIRESRTTAVWRRRTARAAEVMFDSSIRVVLERSASRQRPKSSDAGPSTNVSRFRTKALTVRVTRLSGSCRFSMRRVSQKRPEIFGVKTKSRSCCPCGLITPMASSPSKLRNSSETQFFVLTTWYMSGTSERFLMINFFVQSSFARTVPKLICRCATSMTDRHTLALIGR